MGKSSIIAIAILCAVIILIVVSVLALYMRYKKKMNQKLLVSSSYCRGGDAESRNEQSSNGVFENDNQSKQDSVKFYGIKRNGRIESNSSTSSAMPLLFNRQNSVRGRIPSNGGNKLGLDICEGEILVLSTMVQLKTTSILAKYAEFKTTAWIN